MQNDEGFTGCGKTRDLGEIGEERPSGAEAHVDSAAFAARLKPCPFKAARFSAACKAVPFQNIDFFRDSLE